MIDYAGLDYVKKLEDRISFLEELMDVSPPQEKEKWYENIPDGGVLCWMDYRDGGRDRSPIVFTEYTREQHGNCNPLTKQEIKVFMDNAPEDL